MADFGVYAGGIKDFLIGVVWRNGSERVRGEAGKRMWVLWAGSVSICSCLRR